jgi:hypothetical protein
MSAIETFGFGEYLLRPAGTNGNAEADLELARAWVAADPEHAGKVLPEFWLEQTLGRDSYLLRDGVGPIYFFKMHLLGMVICDFKSGAEDVFPANRMGFDQAVRIFLQFPPLIFGMTGADTFYIGRRIRIANALTEGMTWLERMLKQGPVKEYYFDSQNESLIRFSQKRLGFTRDGSILRKRLDGS